MKNKFFSRRRSAQMKVVMLVNYGRYGEGKVVTVVKAENDWIRTSQGTYIQKSFVRQLNGDPVGKDIVV